MPDIFALIEAARATLTAAIQNLLPHPESALLEGLLVGGGSGLPRATFEAFRRAGILHIVAVSGTNVAIVIATVDTLLFWLPRRWRFVPSVFLITLYTLLTGASASAVRAAVMGCLALLALQLGRQTDRRRLIAAACVLMVAWNPRWLTEDAGFQLSFLAVIGLVEVGPFLEPWFRWLPQTLGIREAVLMTMAAQVTAAPWGAHVFGGFSLIAPLANIFVAPAIPLAMLLGTVSVLLGALFLPLGLLIALPCTTVLSWMIGVAEVLGNVPLASIGVQPSLSLTAAYYLGLGIFLYRRKK